MNDNESQAMNEEEDKEQLYPAQSRVQAMMDKLGVTTTLVLMHYIKSWPDRCYYQMWVLPDHKRIQKALHISPVLYKTIKKSLEEQGYIISKWEDKIDKFIYCCNFPLIEAHFAPLPTDKVGTL